MLDLSQTLNPFADELAPLVSKHLESLRIYPDATEATGLFAETAGVDPERLLLTNGGSEAISLVANELGGGVLREPEFALHPRGHGVKWRSDPHSPSGVLAERESDVEGIAVWDEAFYPLATGRWHGHRPGVTVGSLTKVFACPGLRLGYVIADDVERFRRHQPQWSVNALALAVLGDLVGAADLARWAAMIASARDELTSALRDRGFNVRAADAPWILVEAPGMREKLAPAGVVVRDCTSFDMLGWVRVAVPDHAGLARLLAAIDSRC